MSTGSAPGAVDPTMMPFRHRRRGLGTGCVAAIIAAVVLAVVVLASLGAGMLAPYPPEQVSLDQVLAPPSPRHWMGTDATGRDVFSRVLFSGRTTLLAALGVTVLAVVIGVPVGLVSGYVGGRVDAVLSRVGDVVLAFPPLLMALLLVGVVGRGLMGVTVAVGVVYIPLMARLTRSMAMVAAREPYVEAARVVGCPLPRLLLRHILPQCLPMLSVQIAMDVGYALLDVTAMGFLGLGVQPPAADWGAMLADGRGLVFVAPQCALAPGAMIAVVAVAANVLGDGASRLFGPYRRIRRRGSASGAWPTRRQSLLTEKETI